MKEIERALRAAFAVDAVPEPGAGFEARMAQAARARGRMRAAPLVLAAVVAGAAVATLAIDRRGEEPTRVAFRPAPRARPTGGGSTRSFSEVWQLVIRFGRTWSVHEEETTEDDRVAEQPEPREREWERRRHRRAVEPRLDCGDDPLCPLVAPTAARLRIGVDSNSGWGRVTIDGQDVGLPPLDIELIPGRHRVVVLDGDGAVRTFAIDLRPGERRTLMVSMPDRR